MARPSAAERRFASRFIGAGGALWQPLFAFWPELEWAAVAGMDSADNLLLHGGSGADEDSRLQLIRDAARYRGDRGVDVLTVFDASGGSGTTAALGTPGVRVEYARGDADAAIVRAVRRSERPAEVTVMTADNAVAAAVRALGAKVEDGAGLWQSRPRGRRRRSPPPSDTPAGISDREIAAWLREFAERGGDDEW